MNKRYLSILLLLSSAATVNAAQPQATGNSVVNALKAFYEGLTGAGQPAVDAAAAETARLAQEAAAAETARLAQEAAAAETARLAARNPFQKGKDFFTAIEYKQNAIGVGTWVKDAVLNNKKTTGAAALGGLFGAALTHKYVVKADDSKIKAGLKDAAGSVGGSAVVIGASKGYQAATTENFTALKQGVSNTLSGAASYIPSGAAVKAAGSALYQKVMDNKVTAGLTAATLVGAGTVYVARNTRPVQWVKNKVTGAYEKLPAFSLPTFAGTKAALASGKGKVGKAIDAGVNAVVNHPYVDATVAAATGLGVATYKYGAPKFVNAAGNSIAYGANVAKGALFKGATATLTAAKDAAIAYPTTAKVGFGAVVTAAVAGSGVAVYKKFVSQPAQARKLATEEAVAIVAAAEKARIDDEKARLNRAGLEATPTLVKEEAKPKAKSTFEEGLKALLEKHKTPKALENISDQIDGGTQPKSTPTEVPVTPVNDTSAQEAADMSLAQAMQHQEEVAAQEAADMALAEQAQQEQQNQVAQPVEYVSIKAINFIMGNYNSQVKTPGKNAAMDTLVANNQLPVVTKLKVYRQDVYSNGVPVVVLELVDTIVTYKKFLAYVEKYFIGKKGVRCTVNTKSLKETIALTETTLQEVVAEYVA